MPIHNPVKNAGMRLFMSAAPGGTPAIEIGGITDMGEFGQGRNAIDVTSLADKARRRMKGLIDAGQQRISGTFNPDDAGQSLLAVAVGYDATYNFRIDVPLGATKYAVEFPAHVMEFQVSSGYIDGVIQFSATLAVEGVRTSGTVAA